MDYDYIDIDTIVRLAKKQRDDELGKLISAGWNALKQRFARLVHRRETAKVTVTNPSAFAGS